MSEWVSMADAARELSVSPSKITRLAARGKILTKQDPTDERLKLVDLDQLRTMFSVRTHKEKKERE